MLSEDLEAALEVLTTLLTKPLDIFGGDQMLLLQFLGFRKKTELDVPKLRWPVMGMFRVQGLGFTVFGV